ncbi:MAG: PspA/IM30 family protein [Candidatus Binatia bacterium]
MTRLFDRITRLLKADAHGVVESLEERSLLLKQYVREAELEVGRKRARLDAVREDAKRLRDAAARVAEAQRGLDEDVALALAGGQDELARFAIRRLLARRAEAAGLHAQLTQSEAEAHTLSERLAVQETQLEALRVRVRAELAREVAVDDRPGWPCDAAVADEEVELELLRRRQPDGGRS